MKKKYLLGIDLGTDSCGWCLTDENDHIVRKNGKCLWGVRLFEEAESRADRRSHRTARRRLARRNERIALLRALFGLEIAKVDPKFYIRLDESMLFKEDRSYDYDYPLFGGIGIDEKQYHKDYPTMFHLRKHLIESNQKEDIRLIYLALAHMLKYRGHFLFEGAKFDLKDVSEITVALKNINDALKDEDDADVISGINNEMIDNLVKAKGDNHGINRQKEAFSSIINPNNNKFIKDVIVPLLSGSEIQLKKIVELDESDEDNGKEKISLSSESFDITVNEWLQSYPNDESHINCLIEAKKIFDYLILNKLMSGEPSISYAMVKRYKDHQKDLKELRNYVVNNLKGKYDEIFRKYQKNLNNYSAYIGSTNTKKIGKITGKRCTQEEFYSFLKKELGINEFKKEKDITDPFLRSVWIKMSDNTYLQKTNITENRVLPYQLHLSEMDIILNKQAKFYPFLNEKDEYGTVISKIESIMTFKIPYYVGPLSIGHNEDKSHFGWVERTNEKIYPWNFNKVVDLDTSAEKFITRMLNKCTYLHDQICLPKDSILYQEYMVYSELNKIQVNGEPLIPEVKQDLIDNVYKKQTTVSKKTIEKYFKKPGEPDPVLTSSNGKSFADDTTGFKSSLKTHFYFSQIFGEEYVDSHRDFIDDIVKQCAIFTDKKILEKRLEKIGVTDKEKIKRIKALSFNGFSRFSKMFLEDLRGAEEDGSPINTDSIIHIMAKTNLNLMEIINNPDLGFDNAIRIHNANELDEYNKAGDKGVEDYINSMFVSPGVKRPLIQAYKISDEIERIISPHKIDEYYIECNRSNDAKNKNKVPKSRKQKLQELYSSAKDITSELNGMLARLNDTDEEKFKSDAVYLYFTQLGRDIYTGEPIDFENINNRSCYDIDHIYPQSVIKDDSIDNRVLTSYSNNSSKKDIYPIPYSAFKSSFDHESFQKLLYSKHLISDKKFERLISRQPLTDNEIYNFVNRQIVYTSQSEKALKDVILNFKKTEDGNQPKVIMSKAELVSDFRKDNDLLKCRDINDMHHAHDAFLNIVVGRTINSYFTEDFWKVKYAHDHGYTTNVKKVFVDNDNKNKKNVLDLSGNVVWDYRESLDYVRKQILFNHNMLFTSRTFIRSGLIKNILPTSPKDLKGFALPLKNTNNGPLKAYNDIHKYGGYTDLWYGSYTLFETVNKNSEKNYRLIPIPNIFALNNSEEEKINYAIRYRGLNNPKIVLDNLKINTVIEEGKSRYLISGVTSDQFKVSNVEESFYSYNDLLIARKVGQLNDIIASSKGWDKNKEDNVTKNVNNKFLEKYRNRTIGDEAFIIAVAKNEENEEIRITKDEMIDLYKSIVEHLNRPIFAAFTNIKLQAEFLKSKLDDGFVSSLSIFALSHLLNEVLHFTQNNVELSDLYLIGGKQNCGTLGIPFSMKKGQKIIYQSITGFYEKVVWECK